MTDIDELTLAVVTTPLVDAPHSLDVLVDVLVDGPLNDMFDNESSLHDIDELRVAAYEWAEWRSRLGLCRYCSRVHSRSEWCRERFEEVITLHRSPRFGAELADLSDDFETDDHVSFKLLSGEVVRTTVKPFMIGTRRAAMTTALFAMQAIPQWERKVVGWKEMVASGRIEVWVRDLSTFSSLTTIEARLIADQMVNALPVYIALHVSLTPPRAARAIHVPLPGSIIDDTPVSVRAMEEIEAAVDRELGVLR